MKIVRTAALIIAGVVVIAAAPAATGRHVLIRLPDRTAPAHMAFGLGSIWVEGHTSGIVYRIDPNTNRVVSSINIRQTYELCWPLAVGDGHIWVSDCTAETNLERTFELDPRTGRVLAIVPGETPMLGANSLWLTETLKDYTTAILRLDPRSRIVLTTITDPRLDALAYQPFVGGVGYGSVWIGSDTTIARIDPNTDKLTAVVRLPGAAEGDGPHNTYIGSAELAFAHGKAWIAVPSGLYTIAAKTNRVRRLRAFPRPFSEWGDIPIVAAAGSIWARMSDGTITRFDPATAKPIRTYPASGGGGDILVANHALWVANFGDNTVWREPIG